MARDIARIGKQLLPVVTKVPAGLTVERTDGSAAPVVIESPATVEWSIAFDPREPEDYRHAIRQLKAAVLLHHGPDTLRRLFVPFTKRDLQAARNDRLLAEYIRSGLSIKRCAAVLAEKNKSLPSDYRYGPTDSISKDTMEKQMGGQLKLLKKDPRRHKYIERLASQLAQWAPHGARPCADIS